MPTVTKYCELGSLKQRNFFSPSLDSLLTHGVGRTIICPEAVHCPFWQLLVLVMWPHYSECPASSHLSLICLFSEVGIIKSPSAPFLRALGRTERLPVSFSTVSSSQDQRPFCLFSRIRLSTQVSSILEGRCEYCHL